MDAAAQTIVALATRTAHRPGTGWGTAIVRISGAAAQAIGLALAGDSQWRRGSRWCAAAALGGDAAAQEGIGGLPALLAWAAGPRSYTGEDTLEVLVPGQPEVVRRLMAAMLRSGEADGGVQNGEVRMAQPGEFSARAYHNGRLSLAQAEGVAAVISAASDAEWQAAQRVLSGEQGAVYQRWSGEAAELLALVEAGIDFADTEGVVAISPADLAARSEALARAVGEAAGEQRRGERASGAARVVLWGRPNAGKSTLFNALLGRRRAVVAAVAGTTRDALSERLSLRAGERALEVDLVDVAGVDEGELGTPGTTEAMAGAQAAREAGSADVLVWCVATGEAPDAAPAVNRDGGQTAAVVRVRTKADRALGAGAGTGESTDGWLEVCVPSGLGVEALRAALAHAVLEREGGATAGGGRGVLPTRHRDALARAATQLRAAVVVADRAEEAAAALRAALDALGELTGRVERDEVLGLIFSRFCIGK